jgi:hypothetical protein
VPKAHVGDREDVAGPVLMRVIVQEGTPGLFCPSSRSSVLDVLLDGSFADLDIRREQFPANALGAP